MENSRSLLKNWNFPKHKSYERFLRLAASKWFAERNISVDKKYPFILEKWMDWENNIIIPEVASYIQKLKEERERNNIGFPLHKYIHHGLSSQALLFNLVGPLIIANDLTPLKNVIEKKGLIWTDVNSVAEFEFENRDIFNEDIGQPTSIDLVIKNSSNEPTLFIESKLVEREFGGCSVYKDGDCNGQNPINNLNTCYLHFIGRKYWILLEKYGFLNTQIAQDSLCVLVNNYQYFREILFALEYGGVFILLSDERNPTFYCKGKNDIRGLMTYLDQFIPVDIKKRVGSITIQELVSEIELNKNHSWINEFKNKYAM